MGKNLKLSVTDSCVTVGQTLWDTFEIISLERRTTRNNNCEGKNGCILCTFENHRFFLVVETARFDTQHLVKITHQ